MNIELIVAIVSSLILVALAIIILLGKADWMISGYNTSSEEKKARYNLPRLRLVTSLMLIILVTLLCIFVLTDTSEVVSATINIAVALIGTILQYTWAKRR